MLQRSPELQAFLDSFSSIILERSASIEGASVTARKLSAALLQPAPQNSTVPRRLPACAYLGPAVEAARTGAGGGARTAERFAEVEPMLTWRRRPGSEPDSTAFHDGHANATIVGPGGLEERGDLRIGVSLLAPMIQYPEHRHPPDEIYLALSAGEWQQDASPWFSPGPGHIVFNSSDTLHSMRSGETPLLAIWCLWSGVQDKP